MSRLCSRPLAVIVVLSFVSCMTSANSLKNVLQRKRNPDTAVPQEMAVDPLPEHEEVEIPQQSYTPDAFPPCISIEYLTVLKDRFESQIDKNNDGKATFDEMRLHLKDYNDNVRNSTVRAFIARRDLDHNGVIEFVPEYVKNVVTPDYSVENAREWFNLDDTDGNGQVTPEELMAISRHIGTPEEQAKMQVQHYYMSNDQNKDGQLNFDEYKVIYGQ